MPQFQILYLRDSEIERFRQAAPKEQQLLQRHYEDVGRIEAPGAYAAWANLQGEGAQQRGIRKMGVGDVLAREGERPLLCHFWGFEEAEWRQQAEGERPEPATQAQGDKVSSGGEHTVQAGPA
jgi:hypothetical protein